MPKGPPLPSRGAQFMQYCLSQKPTPPGLETPSLGPPTGECNGGPMENRGKKGESVGGRDGGCPFLYHPLISSNNS
ncbi:hypothetical protein TIFTF001_003767 [Ficus carica]|uniref:Uncharacterized protein n=1 Tax=Ficus carica TaxID=3494 RepID=A0AA87ZIF3_FICCA|nr:hypothetical protein TIFTF001_003767 [Ficus carica]